MSPDDIHTLAGAYALDALSDTERAAFARHLASCESCAQEMAEFRETVGRLAGADATAPPARLRAAVLAEARRTPQAGPFRVADRRARGRSWRGWAAEAAAVVVVAAGAGTIGYTISDQRVRGADQRANAAASLDARLEAVLTAPDAQVHTNHPADGGNVTVVTSALLNQGVAVLADMPALPGGKVYQLWLITDAGPVSAGVMAPGVRAGTTLLVGVGAAGAFGVSKELPGGASTPSNPLVTSFSI